jgi:LysM repeat protein
LCPAWKYRALSAHRHYPLSASTGLERAVFPCVLACENFKAQSEKGKLAGVRNTPPMRVKPRLCAGLPIREQDAKMAAMKFSRRIATAIILSLLVCSYSAAQNPEKSESALENLTKKIDAQNTKIDALSQQILKLQQEISPSKGAGAVIEKATPLPSISAEVATHTENGGATHVVTRGETLTSIAKMHKVGIEDLQKFNHIENDRKLQIGQTLMLPGSPAPSPSASPSPTE